MKEELNILVVDDEREITDLVAIHLSNDYRVIKCYDSTEVMKIMKENKISLVILDIMMPNIDGLTICKMIRESYNIPIIMLSAKSMDTDKVIGLTYGADDYIVKPFNPIELVARVKAQLRRFIKFNPKSCEADIEDCIELNGLSVNRENHTVILYEEKVNLTRREFDILYLLLSRPNKVFASEEIFEKVWKERYYEVSNNTVMVHIRHLRKKLGDDSRKPKFIKTVWGVGYKIVC